MRAYRLERDGQIVYTLRSTIIAPDGREEHLTRGKVGRAGEVFFDLPQYLADAIEAGEYEGTYTSIDIEEDAPESIVEQPQPAPEARDYSKMSPRDLMEEATERGLDVQGTGEGGRVLKTDVITALEASDREG